MKRTLEAPPELTFEATERKRFRLRADVEATLLSLLTEEAQKMKAMTLMGT